MTGEELPPMEGDTIKELPPTEMPAAPPGASHGSPVHADQVEPSRFTHESKLPPVRLEEPRPRLATGPTVLAISGLLCVIALATAFAFSSGPPAAKPAEPSTEQVAASEPVQVPDVIQDQPTAPSRPAPSSAEAGPFDRVPDGGAPVSSGATRTEDPLRRTRREARQEELEKALTSSLYANIDDPFASDPKSVSPSAGRAAMGAVDPNALARGSAPGSVTPNDPNLQERKNEFLGQTDRSDGYLANQLIRPRSPYEVKAGTIIPTVLVTGINSDLPGTILGQVRENVYDTVSGNYLLIPQGSKLLASYDSMVAYGQERVLVCWQRLIRPDGTSLSLDCQPGVDLAGYAGFADTVDYHWWRVLTGVALGSVLAAGVVVPQGNVSGYVPTIGQGMAANAAGAVNQAGQQITTRALNIQPTIKVRPGFSVNVLVTKDLVIPPYPSHAVTP
jgi:type IV secretion system protein VirB10